MEEVIDPRDVILIMGRLENCEAAKKALEVMLLLIVMVTMLLLWSLNDTVYFVLIICRVVM